MALTAPPVSSSTPQHGGDLAAAAAAMIAEGSKSFATAARLFDARTRRSAILLYAWCRHCDDVVDGQRLGHASMRQSTATALEDPVERLDRLEAASFAALDGHDTAEIPFRALAEVATVQAIPRSLVRDHLEGYRSDVEGRSFVELGDTLTYCYQVAGAVGVMMARVMGVRDAAVLDRACDLGIAFQLTNIARDLVEDARVGRCYVPERWLDEVGLSRPMIAEGSHPDRVAAIADRLIETAEPYYAAARHGIAALPPRSAWAVATALGVYRAIGLAVKARGSAAWDARVSTTRPQKVAHVVRGGATALWARRAPVRPRPSGLWTRPGSADG